MAGDADLQERPVTLAAPHQPNDFAFRFLTRRDHGVLVGVASGSLQSTAGSTLTDIASEAVPAGASIVFDMVKVTFIDASGIADLVSLQQGIAARGGSLDLVLPVGTARRSVAAAGLSKVLRFHATRKEAMDSARSMAS